jgi:hypothetical protein
MCGPDSASYLTRIHKNQTTTSMARMHPKTQPQASQVQTNALQSAAERAHGVQYTESMKTGWRPPGHIRAMTKEDCDVRACMRACVRA